MEEIKEMPGLFKMCVHCCNMYMRDGVYCCDIVRNKLGYGEVTPDMDASQCVKNEWFKWKSNI